MRRLSPVPNAILAAIVLGAVQLLGCSSNCIPGATIFCPCPNGTQSNQTCKSDGSYTACACGGTSGGATTGAAAETSGSTTGESASSAGTNGSGGSITGNATTGGAAGTSGGPNGTSGTSSGGTTGGNGGLTCSAPIDNPGNCNWPEFCVSGHCLAPQNMNAQGQDAPALACVTSAATPQGSGNLDSERASGVIDLLGPNSPIITDLQQVPISEDDGCIAFIGPGATEYQESADACAGGTVDDAGVAICAPGEAAMLFSGGVFDPHTALPGVEGNALDAQFYWMTSAQTPVRFTDSAFGAAQSGFIIPGSGWNTGGGRFIMVQCLSQSQYPLAVNSYPITLHFVTSGIVDGGIPGNSFCTQWSP